MTTADEVHLRYTGAQAEGYDQAREASDRHRREDAAVAAALAASRPRSLLDCPVGTGRWLPHYQGVEKVIGIDRSPDMLAVARTKAGDDAGGRVQLLEGSIFDQDLFARLEPVDLVVCVRFLNWVDAPRAVAALANLDRVAARDLLVGVTVRPRAWSSVRRARARVGAGWAHLGPRGRKRARRYVHDEGAVLDRFAALGWSVVGQQATLELGDRVNYLYSLSK